MYKRIFLLIALNLLAACGGGGDSSSGPPPTYTISATVSGLAGTGLVLQNNGGNDLSVAANGAATFSTTMTSGGAYAVTVRTQPTALSQTCVVTNGSGTVSGSNVANILVACTTNTYSIGGAVSGLNGAGLVLQNNGSNDLAISADGSLVFTSAIASGGAYNVTVKTQPASTPAQTCVVSNGSGTVTNAAVSSVTITCRNLVGRFVYVPNIGSDNVSAYAINPNTGALTPVPGSPFLAGAGPSLATADPASKFLYVINVVQGTSATLTGYVINSATGALTAVSTTPYSLAFGAGATASKAIVHPAGGHLYVPASTAVSSTPTSTSTHGFSINSATGELAPVSGSPYVTGGPATQSGTFDSTGRFFYVPYGILFPAPATGGMVAVYQVDASTGALSLLGTAATGGNNPIRVIIHPTGKFAYVPNAQSSNLAAYSIDATTGVLTAIAGSPFAADQAPLSAAFHPSGNFFYVGGDTGTGPTPGAGSVSAFSISASSGVLTPIAGSPVATGGNNARGVGVYPDGKYLLATNVASASVAIYGINATTGALTPAVGSPFSTPSTSPGRVVVDPSGRFAYLTDMLANIITAFSIDASLGTITVVGSYPTGTTPTSTPEIVGLQ